MMAQTSLQLFALFQHLQKSIPVTQVHHRHHSLSQKLCLLQTPQHLHSLQPKDFGATAQALFCMQVSVVEQACTKYLLSLNLEPRQLLDMASLFDTLGKPAAYKQSLQKLFEMPWKTEQVMAIIAEACSKLLDQGPVGMELCRELLHSTKRGALCEMQVSAAVMNNLYTCCDEQFVYMSAVLLLHAFPMSQPLCPLQHRFKLHLWQMLCSVQLNLFPTRVVRYWCSLCCCMPGNAYKQQFQ